MNVKVHYQIILVIALLILLPIVALGDVPDFGEQQDICTIRPSTIDEASGLVASSKYPGVLWTHNDSGDDPKLYAFNLDGEIVAEVTLQGIKNRDWEDIAIAPSETKGEYDLYIGEIGDNGARYNEIEIYKIREPEIDINSINKKLSVKNEEIQTITLCYPDGARDSEAFFVEPSTKDIFVITKRESTPRLYKAIAPYSENKNYLEFIKEIKTESLGPLSWITGADISPDGNEILMRSYLSIFYYKRENGKPVESAFDGSIEKVPYGPATERQGEAICWSHRGEGYYTISESVQGSEQHLYYYQRIINSIKPKNAHSVTLKTKKNKLFMEFNTPLRKNERSIEIYNSIGKMVGVVEADSLSRNELVFDLTHLKRGLYFCRIHGKTKKVMIY